MLCDIIKKEIERVIKVLYDKELDFEVFAGGDFGDYSSNAAMVLKEGNSIDAAENIKKEIVKSKELDKWVDKIEIAGPGFLNFCLKREVFSENIVAILKEKENYGKNKIFSGKKIMVEYTDPNPFKEFHIGHLMSNAIGESIARILEFCGAEIKRANYQGDVGLHVAKAIWNFQKRKGNAGSKKDIATLVLGRDYAEGNAAYKKDEEAKNSINEINQKIYEESEKEINKIYGIGRKKSLEYFEKIYERFGTKFDFYFFESEVSGPGKAIIAEYLKKGVFEKSDGAIVFRGEKYGLHTRVFLTSEGLPTYEAKELGLAKAKSEKYPFDVSISVTGSEIIDYFRVVLKAMEIIYPNIATKIRHIPHGMTRLATGKMSSRTGEVVSAESLLGEVFKLVYKKAGENEELSAKERQAVSDIVAVGAIKYSILKQSIGQDIIFDFEKSISLEGDSGAYLQYTYARANSVLEKSAKAGINASVKSAPNESIDLEKILYTFPEIVERSSLEYAPNHIAEFLIDLARAFNNFYARERIVDSGFKAPYRLALTEAVAITLKNGLWLLGIQAPEKM